MPHRNGEDRNNKDRNEDRSISRRIFLKQMQWAPALFLPAPFTHPLVRYGLPRSASVEASPFPLADRLTPHYPAKSPLDDILRLAAPGTDEYVVEGYASEIAMLLAEWSHHLKTDPPATAILNNFVDASMQSTALIPVRESALRPGDPIEVLRREFASTLLPGRDQFLDEIKTYLAPLKQLETADFEIYEVTQRSQSPLTLEARIRYEFVGTRENQIREERIGSWLTRWSRNESGVWRALQWSATSETLSRAAGPIFTDITSHALGQTDSYKAQFAHGADYWRTVLDGAVGVDVYGNNGVAVGDFDNDGLDDLYVCQPAGLPNRLYRNRGDGTFEDVTEKSGLGVLDFTACALFADFQNRGLQDLLVVCATGPLLFINDYNGKFSLKKDGFRFAHPPQGAFTHAAAADYDRDGRLDIYFCLYSYYQGLEQYRYPVPYFDARNGPPNYLFHNEGNGVFEDRTEAAGLNVENDRYSFACSWGDSKANGWPDLYVVNDFGRNNLYRNNRDGTFSAASTEAQVDEAGAGMSACWLDFDNDGKQDIYAAGMWVAAGMRVFGEDHFHAGEPENIRALYRRHMTGNSLYRNQGTGKFQNLAMNAGVEMGRWSWSTDSWDFDHDGYPDVYVANGYISGADERDVSSFFWRQVVAKSPLDSSPSRDYERGWSAMNELIRSDSTWNGHERNVFFANNRDGTFSDVSGVVGMDFRDDSRAFALADFDGDGRLELVLKNRNAPQIRILRLAMTGIGNSITLRLRGTKSNRDAIGAAVTVVSGNLRQTKYLQAGSGFLSQHTKELSFGLGKNQGPVRATVRWPSGLTQELANLPVNHRIAIEEGAQDFQAKPFATSPKSWSQPGDRPSSETLPQSVGTWLIEPVKAPNFSLPDQAGNLRDLRSLQGPSVLLTFCKPDSRACRDQLQRLNKSQSALAAHGLRIAVNVHDPSDTRALQSFASKEGLSFPILSATPEVAGIYNIVYRYMLDRHRDLSLPTSFLIDDTGNIVKLYQGLVAVEDLQQDLASIPRTPEDRLRKALPFPGTLVQDSFQRNDFTYGVAFFQHGFLDQAARSFEQVIAEKPNDPEAYYNLGTLYLRRNSPQQARQYLEQTVKLRPNYPEAWNNLGMLAAQSGNTDEAIRNFQRSLQLRPAYATALVNLGNLYRRQGNLAESEQLLTRALASEPTNPEVNYSLGMLYARQNKTDNAVQYLEKAIDLRPDYFDALNNLGVLFVQARRYPEAEEKFRTCIQRAPDFDQAYLNLARLYLVLTEKEKARAVLQALLQKQPQHKMAQQMLQVLY
ncbi:MAG TPA: tetratricopeptide repeat protein [Candidatus Sulfotelmatobacter sp.]|nr:tetratricopeptide repeat protein [Candidatus Sulfotelmatobacter sp.]